MSRKLLNLASFARLALVAIAPLVSFGAGCGSKAEAVPLPDGTQSPGDDDDTSSVDGSAPAAEDGAAPKDDGSTPPPDASSGVDAGDGALPTSSGVSIVVEPSDKGAALVSALKAATKSIHMTMYLLTSTDVMNALVQAKGRGVEVKVVLNQNFPTGGNSNAPAYTTLTNGGVSVVYAPSFYTYTHEKCVIVDGNTAWIMTMNATKTSPTDNREFLAIDTDAADVAEADAIFEGDFAGPAANNPVGKLLVAPVNARDGLLALIASATHTLDVEGEELSDTKITSALAQKAQAGMPVRVVLATGNTSPAQTQAVASLKQAGAKVVTQSTPYIHAKAIVADGARAYVGSANFTAGSLGYNRELGLIVDTAAEVAKVAGAIATDFGTGTAL